MFVLKVTRDFIKENHTLIPLQGGSEKTKTLKYELNSKEVPKIIENKSKVSNTIDKDVDIMKTYIIATVTRMKVL